MTLKSTQTDSLTELLPHMTGYIRKLLSDLSQIDSLRKTESTEELDENAINVLISSYYGHLGYCISILTILERLGVCPPSSPPFNPDDEHYQSAVYTVEKLDEISLNNALHRVSDNEIPQDFLNKILQIIENPDLTTEEIRSKLIPEALTFYDAAIRSICVSRTAHVQAWMNMLAHPAQYLRAHPDTTLPPEAFAVPVPAEIHIGQQSFFPSIFTPVIVPIDPSSCEPTHITDQIILNPTKNLARNGVIAGQIDPAVRPLPNASLYDLSFFPDMMTALRTATAKCSTDDTLDTIVDLAIQILPDRITTEHRSKALNLPWKNWTSLIDSFPRNDT